MFSEAAGQTLLESVTGFMIASRTASRRKQLSPLMDAVLRHADSAEVQITPTPGEICADIDALIESFALQRIRRFYGQRHWHHESTAAEYSDKAEPGLKLENVAAHSWHVADAACLLAGHFPYLDLSRVVLLALLHDKLEIYTGDYDPVGSDGKGTETHAFNETARLRKRDAERSAAQAYLGKLRSGAREFQRELIEEMIDGGSLEARFVKACDKLQALAFVMEKKAGQIADDHLLFTLRYSRKALVEFPRIRFHYAELLNRFLNSVAAQRKTTRAALDKAIFGQLELPL